MVKERRSLTQAIEKVAERIVHEHEEHDDEKLQKSGEKLSKKDSEPEPKIIKSSNILP